MTLLPSFVDVTFKECMLRGEYLCSLDIFFCCCCFFSLSQYISTQLMGNTHMRCIRKNERQTDKKQTKTNRQTRNKQEISKQETNIQNLKQKIIK